MSGTRMNKPENRNAQPDRRFVSYSQNFEDVMLWRALRHVKSGFYIDVGANDPVADSVTCAFYERGWHGINVEPLPGRRARLAQMRPRDITLGVALGRENGSATLHVIGEEGGLSTTNAMLAAHHGAGGFASSPREVSVTTLAALCEKHVGGDIHFLKIDAEGAELDILHGADFTRWRPWIIVLEAPDPALQLPRPEEWDAEVLTPQGYEFAWFDGLNRFYLAREHAGELRPAFAAPPNVFDDFVHAREKRAIAALASARAECAALAAERDSCLQELYESDRYAAELTVTRQTFMREADKIREHERRLVVERDHLKDHERRLVMERDRLKDHETRLIRERDNLRDHERRLLAEVDGLKHERDAARARVARIEGSRTWRFKRRLGRVFGQDDD
jgi:FkbM family methyltransferase